MNVGDRIFVLTSCTKYGGRCCGHYGTVERIYLCDGSSLRFLVRIDDLINDNLVHGGFWFERDDIGLKLSKTAADYCRNDVLVTQSLYFKKGIEKTMNSNNSDSKKTIKYILDSMSHEQRTAVYGLVSIILQDEKNADDNNRLYLPKIKKVIFNPPATIILWQDDTKTIVKAVNEPYDPEKGLAMAISKKAFGNNQSYYSIFERNIKKFKSNTLHADDDIQNMAESFSRLEERLRNFN